MTDVANLIRQERVALIDLLRTLGPDEWATPSLCTGWTVQDVAAHLAWAPASGVRETTLALVRGGFRLNKINAELAVNWSRRGPAAILDQLAVNAASGAKPPGVPADAALVDAVVHALDIRRPLDEPRPVPREAFERAADFCLRLRRPLSILTGSARERAAGLRLVAQDSAWSHGQGPEVRGSADALILVLTGRPVGSDELTGPGADRLSARL